MESRYRKCKLTQSVVDGAKSEASRYTLTDTSIPGSWLVVERNGRKTFKFRYRVGGGRGATVREPKIGDASAMRTEKARAVAADWHADVAKGGDPSGVRQAQRAAPTMADLFERYMSDHALPHKRASSVAADQQQIAKYLLPAFGRRKVAEVTRADIDRFHKSHCAKPYRANRCLALLSKAFTLAEVWHWRPDGSNPCRHVKKFAEAKRSRFLSNDELARLGETLRFAEFEGSLTLPAEAGKRKAPERVPITRWAIAAIRLLIFTGARKGEILSLQWSKVNRSTGTATVYPKEAPTVKGKAAGEKTVMLSPAALEVLASLPQSVDNCYVIQGGKPGTALVNLKDPWLAIREHARLDGVRVHDLRHSFASVGAAIGASLPIIGALLGHRQNSATARYAHLHSDPLQSAGLIGGRIAAAMDAPGNTGSTQKVLIRLRRSSSQRYEQVGTTAFERCRDYPQMDRLGSFAHRQVRLTPARLPKCPEKP
jgi:integrase